VPRCPRGIYMHNLAVSAFVPASQSVRDPQIVLKNRMKLQLDNSGAVRTLVRTVRALPQKRRPFSWVHTMRTPVRAHIGQIGDAWHHTSCQNVFECWQYFCCLPTDNGELYVDKSCCLVQVTQAHLVSLRKAAPARSCRWGCVATELGIGGQSCPQSVACEDDIT